VELLPWTAGGDISISRYLSVSETKRPTTRNRNPTHALPPFFLLAEDAVVYSAAGPWWQLLLNNALTLTILAIFITAIIVALLNAWSRDKCLRLMHDYHVTLLSTTGIPTWGDLVVYSRGIELRFDAPYVTRRGTVKSSSLVYDDEMSDCLALCRISTALTKNESRSRARQVTRTFRPNLLALSLRTMRNIANTLRDATLKALSVLLGQFAKSKPALAGGKSEVEQLGKSLLGTVEHAYEPILERHIGRPVILKLTNATNNDLPPIELPGYLVDYTDKYVAVFNVEHTSEEALELQIEGPMERAGCRVTLNDDSVSITATGSDVLVVRQAVLGQREYDLDVVLLPGCQLQLPCDCEDRVALNVERAKRIDVVCPRALARICFGSDEPQMADVLAGRKGLAPKDAVDEPEEQAHSR
jgi:hypothetical protein